MATYENCQGSIACSFSRISMTSSAVYSMAAHLRYLVSSWALSDTICKYFTQFGSFMKLLMLPIKESIYKYLA